jgi:hypothetical protein
MRARFGDLKDQRYSARRCRLRHFARRTLARRVNSVTSAGVLVLGIDLHFCASVNFSGALTATRSSAGWLHNTTPLAADRCFCHDFFAFWQRNLAYHLVAAVWPI